MEIDEYEKQCMFQNRFDHPQCQNYIASLTQKLSHSITIETSLQID